MTATRAIVGSFERPRGITFSGPMVPGVLDGSKDMTRRVVKPQPEAAAEFLRPCGMEPWLWNDGGSRRVWQCPYGKVGDYVFCRESFWVVDCPGSFGPHWLYEDEFARYTLRTKQAWDDYDKGVSWAHKQPDGFWSSRSCGLTFGHKPSIHMPRWASRQILRIEDIRAERIGDISEADAIREGVAPLFTAAEGKKRPELALDPMPWANYLWHGHIGRTITRKQSDAWDHQYSSYKTARDSFTSLWASINGSWTPDVWVWVLTFSRVTP